MDEEEEDGFRGQFLRLQPPVSVVPLPYLLLVILCVVRFNAILSMVLNV